MLQSIQNILAPVTTGLLNVPFQAAVAFIMGIIQRDFGAAGLNSLALTPQQTLVSLIAITPFVPCIASIIVIFKERSWRESLAIWGGSRIRCFWSGRSP